MMKTPAPGPKRKTLEIHEHCSLVSKFSPSPRLVHSHEGGNTPHEHAGHGPAAYTIDRDEWFEKTGLRGGGRKRFTVLPTGPQLVLVARPFESFTVIVCEKPSPSERAVGPGIALPERIAQRFKLPYKIKLEGRQ